MDYSIRKSRHSRIQSDVTEVRESSATPHLHIFLGPSQNELTLNRNIVVLAEKQKIFESREEALKRIMTDLKGRKEELMRELTNVSQRLAHCLLIKEQITGQLEMQKVRKDAAQTECKLKAQQLDLLPASHKRESLQVMKHAISKAKEVTDGLKVKIIRASTVIIAQDQDLVSQATELKRKQSLLVSARERFCVERNLLRKLKEEVPTTVQEIHSLEAELCTLNYEFLTLVKSSAQTRTLLCASEHIVAQQQAKAKEKQETVEAIRLVIEKKSQHIVQLQEEIERNKALTEEHQSRISQLASAEGEMKDRMRQKLATDSKWKSVHFSDLSLILERMARIRDKEKRLLDKAKVKGRESV